MNRLDFLNKYPEMSESGQISETKISLLKNWMTSSLARHDHKIRALIHDYDLVMLSEMRNQKIDSILERTT